MRHSLPLPSSVLTLLVFASAGIHAAVPNRIARPVDTARTRVVTGHPHRLALPQFDRGAADPAMPMDYMVLIFKPSASQQSDLDSLLAAQQNPSSPLFHQWLAPEEFGNRFGLSPGDHSKVVAWLASQGFTVNRSARARNWVAFSGAAGQVSRSLHTPIHRFQVDGVTHFANTADPSVPEALAGVVGGFLGLNDFRLQSLARVVNPDFNSGSSHYLVPEDFATVYDLTPLYKAGIDGTGQSIVVVGQSDIQVSDIHAFRTRYNLPANDPKTLPYGADPGFNSAYQLEADLDLEWAGAIAPNATIYYVYGTNALTAIATAVDVNLAPVISVSLSACEIEADPSYRSVAQQANAQGTTIVAASGDSGAAGCDAQGAAPFATEGPMVDFPAVMPEVTGVGGTQFSEGTGTFWAATNDANSGSALSYIPEAAWNESSAAGLGASGGGASQFYARPAWQTGPGVPNDNARHVPDVALSAAGHDAYVINYLGATLAVAGTSAAAPSMAGIVALLNHYQVAKGFQKQPGLGNINPQLYRLAQSAPSAFHDITSGNNIVNCAQGTPDCLTGSFGYPALAGYDMATGLGSVDANNLATLWNTQTQGVSVSLLVNPTKPTANDTVAVTAIVVPANGNGTPAGTVAFSAGTLPLGSANLTSRAGQLAADLFFPAYELGPGTFLLTAQYSGDAAFSSGGATKFVQIVAPTGAAAIIPSWPDTVWPNTPDAQGLTWQTNFSLREAAGVPAMVTGFTVDGQAQPLAQYFPSPDIPANGTLSATIVFRNLAAPVSRLFAFTGIDAAGNSWSRQFSVNYNPLPPAVNAIATATPLIVARNTAADPSCQWPVQVNIDELGGTRDTVTALFAGAASLSSEIPAIFGTPRLNAWADLQGTICFGGITPPAEDVIEVDVAGYPLQVTVSFARPPASPAKLSATPSSISMSLPPPPPAPPPPAPPSNGILDGPAKGVAVEATLAVNISDKTQPWTAAIFPTNRMASWLTALQYSGTGPGQITLFASGTGFEPGAYRAMVVIQSPNAIPQSIEVPVMFVLGGSYSGTAITAVANSASYQPTASPGMILSVFGTNLANTTQSASGTILPYALAGVSAVVNGVAAPLIYVSPNQVNLQIPYEVGAGWAVLGINNNGQIAGFLFQINPSAPGIFVDANGNLSGSATAKQGGSATLYLTGAGEVNPLIITGSTSAALLANQAKPVLPLSLTVGGVPAFVQLIGLAPNQFGTAQVNFLVPNSVSPGVQPVVVTVGGVSSKAANLTVEAAQ